MIFYFFITSVLEYNSAMTTLPQKMFLLLSSQETCGLPVDVFKAHHPEPVELNQWR